MSALTFCVKAEDGVAAKPMARAQDTRPEARKELIECFMACSPIRRPSRQVPSTGISGEAGEKGPCWAKIFRLALRSAFLYLLKEPHARERPVALDGARSDAEDARHFLYGEATEVTHLDDLGLAGVELFEAREGFFEKQELGGALFGDSDSFIEVNANLLAATHGGVVLAGVIDEDAAHHVGGKADEVCVVLPLDVLLLGDSKVGLVDKGGGLESMVAPFAAHVAFGEAVELGVDERQELVGGSLVPAIHRLQQKRDFAGSGHGGSYGADAKNSNA